MKNDAQQVNTPQIFLSKLNPLKGNSLKNNSQKKIEKVKPEHHL
jgi:hypothetical protein